MLGLIFLLSVVYLLVMWTVYHKATKRYPPIHEDNAWPTAILWPIFLLFFLLKCIFLACYWGWHRLGMDN